MEAASPPQEELAPCCDGLLEVRAWGRTKLNPLLLETCFAEDFN